MSPCLLLLLLLRVLFVVESSRLSHRSPRVDELKYDEDSTHPGKDDRKQQEHQTRGMTKRGHTTFKENIIKSGDSNSPEAPVYSLRNRVVNLPSALKEKGAELIEEEIQPRLRQAERKAGRAAKQLRSNAKRGRTERKQDSESHAIDDGEDVSEESDSVDDSSPEWSSQLRDRGSSLLHAAGDATSSIGQKIRKAVPNIERKLKRGVADVTKRVKGISRGEKDWDEKKSEEDEDDEEDISDQEEDEVDEEEEDHAPSLGSSLRSRDRRTSSGMGHGRASLDANVHQLAPRVKRSIGRVREGLGRTIEDAKEYVGTATRDAKSRLDAMVEQPDGSERSVGSRLWSWFDLDGSWLRDRESPELDEDEDEDEGADLSPSEIQNGPGPSRSGRHSNESFSVKLEPIKLFRGESRDSAASTKTIARLIGGLFALWLLLSVYNFVGHPADDLTDSHTLFDAARRFGHDMSQKAGHRLDNWREHSQELADLLAGRRPEPTIGQRIGAFGTSVKEAIFGKPVHHFDARDAKEAILNGIGHVEDATYRVVDTMKDQVLPELRYRGQQVASGLKGARDYTRDTLLPGARGSIDRVQEAIHDSKDDLAYHRAHAKDYLNVAKESANNLGDMVRGRAEEIGIIQKPTRTQRLWAWLTGEETTIEKAQRLAGEGYGRATDIARDLKERMAGGQADARWDNIKATMQGGVESIKESVMPDDSFGRRFKLGLHSIRTHMPGHKPTAVEIAQDALDRAKAEAAGWRGTVADWADYVRSEFADAQSHIPSADDLRSGVERGARSLKNALEPDQSVSSRVGSKLHDGFESISQHLPGYQPSAKDFARDTIDRARHEAKSHHLPTVDELKEHAYDMAWDAKDHIEDGVNAIKDKMPRRTMTDRLKDGINAVKSRIPGTSGSRTSNIGQQLHDGIQEVRSRVNELGQRVGDTGKGHQVDSDTLAHLHSAGVQDRFRVSHVDRTDLDLPLGEVVPMTEVLDEIRHAEPPQPHLHKDTMTDRVRHVVQDGVDAIKSHLPHRPHATHDAYDADSIHLRSADSINGLHRVGADERSDLRHPAGDSRRHNTQPQRG